MDHEMDVRLKKFSGLVCFCGLVCVGKNCGKRGKFIGKAKKRGGKVLMLNVLAYHVEYVKEKLHDVPKSILKNPASAMGTTRKVITKPSS